MHCYCVEKTGLGWCLTCKGLQPLIKHLPICLWHCCVQLRRDTVTRLICRPAALWQHIRGVYHAGTVATELLSKQMKISFQPAVHCCAAITGQCCIVLLRDPVTLVGDKVEEDGWISAWWVFIVRKTGSSDHSRALSPFLRCSEKLLSRCCVGGKNWSASSPAAAFRSQQQQL